jgi:hypothetical protein
MIREGDGSIALYNIQNNERTRNFGGEETLQVFKEVEGRKVFDTIRKSVWKSRGWLQWFS